MTPAEKLREVIDQLRALIDDGELDGLPEYLAVDLMTLPAALEAIAAELAS